MFIVNGVSGASLHCINFGVATDPCCGSGHILAYLFDVLMQIYESYGYTAREAVASIVQNNLYGLDIDDRAAQLAYFAVMMKARQYDRRFFSRGIQPHVYAIQESNGIDHAALEYFCNGDAKLKAAMDSIIKELHDAKEYGSILNVTPVDFAALYARFDEVRSDINMSKEAVLNDLLPLVQAAETLSQKYDVVVTNPPYMGSASMGAKLADYVKKNYLDSKSDLFAVFIEACGKMTRKNGYQAMITQHAWMFLSSFEKLRTKLLQKDTVNMTHLGARAFDEIGGEVVQTTSFVLRNSHVADYKSTYCRLVEPTTQQGKEDMFLAGINRYIAQQINFLRIPGCPVAYWVFIEACGKMTRKNGYQAMITQHAWMFLSSFEKLRTKLLQKDTVNMTHLGARAFDEIGGEVVQTTSFVLRNSHVADYKSTYCRLVEPTTQQGKEDMFLAGINRYIAQQINFLRIPGCPVAYWVSNNAVNDFVENEKLDKWAEVTRGLTTGNNEIYLRLWYEVAFPDFCASASSVDESIKSKKKWFPHNKGGEFRAWYGNNDLIVFFENGGEKLRLYYEENKAVRFTGIEHYFETGITWSALTTNKNSFRYSTNHIFDSNKGPMLFTKPKQLYYILGFLNSCVTNYFISVLNPSLSLQNADMNNLPYIQCESVLSSVNDFVVQNIRLSKNDWDSFETSWDFETHPMIRWSKDVWDVTAIGAAMRCYYGSYPQVSSPLELCYLLWKGQANKQFRELKANEEELNRIFIDIYGLQDELTPEVADKDVTVHYLVDNKDDIPDSLQSSNYVLTRRDAVVSLISYAVGCMFGRYSLDVDGLVYAGGDFDAKYCRWVGYFGDRIDEAVDEDGRLTGGGWAGCSMFKYDGIRKDGKWVLSVFPPDTDNIIPICDDEYFEDDIVGRFVKFIETVYGSDTLEENLKFIADALGGKGTPRNVIRSYFLNDFYADHCKTYQKRPIYWLFDSGKKDGFKALIYMHRYAPDTIARIRTDYVHEQQARYRNAIADLESRIAAASTAERVKLNKTLAHLKDQNAELQDYEEKIHHLADQMIPIDLDDGVKVNYAKFQDILAKIK